MGDLAFTIIFPRRLGNDLTLPRAHHVSSSIRFYY